MIHWNYYISVLSMRKCSVKGFMPDRAPLAFHISCNYISDAPKPRKPRTPTVHLLQATSKATGKYSRYFGAHAETARTHVEPARTGQGYSALQKQNPPGINKAPHDVSHATLITVNCGTCLSTCCSVLVLTMSISVSPYQSSARPAA